MCGRHIGKLLFPLIAAGVLANGSVVPAPVAISQSACPNCKTQVLSSFDWCPQCGTGLKPRACAYCGSQVKGGERFCPSCGAPAVSQRNQR